MISESEQGNGGIVCVVDLERDNLPDVIEMIQSISRSNIDIVAALAQREKKAEYRDVPS